MPQSPPLYRPDETLSEAFLRGVRENPNRTFIDDRSAGKTLSWTETSRLISGVIQNWDERGYGKQILVMGDGTWRTVVLFLAGHFSGRLLVMADSQNPTTYKGSLIERARLEVVDVESVDEIAKNPVAFSELSSFYSWTTNEIGRAFLTSGSTGTPKLLGSISESLNGGPSPLFMRGVSAECYSVLNFRRPSTLAFSANLQRTVRSNGIIILIDLVKDDFLRIDQLLENMVVTEINTTPTIAIQLVSKISRSWIHSVECVNISGEKVGHACLASLRRTFPNALLRNNYGMTEVPGNISNLIMETYENVPNDPIPVGKPTSGLTVEILSDTDEKLLDGDIGRIVVGGLPASVQGQVTDSGEIVFEILHPEGQLETGDLGFVDENGMLVVVGRSQQMVKIRGERVSLLDIENAALETGLVKSALAASYTNELGQDAVGVLIVNHPERDVNVADLRKAICDKHRLVLAPTRVVSVETLPVLSVGKADRVIASRILQENNLEKTSEVYSAVEMTLAQIVASALGVDFVRREDDIFSLGADSLSCLHILYAIEEDLGTKVEISFLLQFPTIIEMASGLSREVDQSVRTISLSTGVTNPTIYWALPGSNPYMARPIAISSPEARHIALLNLGSLSGDVVNGSYEQMVMTLSRAIVDDDHAEDFFIAGFSSACYLANAVSVELVRNGRTPAGLIIIDPPTHQSVIEEWKLSGKIAHPIHMVTAREGRLAMLDPGAADLALFGLQLFALSRHQPERSPIPRLFIGSSDERFLEEQWCPGAGDTVSIFAEDHLDFVRKPASVVQSLRSWDVMKCLVGDFSEDLPQEIKQ